MKQKHLIETPMCPQKCLLIISNTTGLSFALERIGPLAAFIIIVFYLLILYLLALSNTPENPFASIYSESLIKTACQHLLLLVGFDTLIYQKYYDTPPILVDRGWPLGCGPIFTDSRDLWRGTRMNTMNTTHKSKANTHTHTQDTHWLSSLAWFTNSTESQGRDYKSRIPCERLIC
jgi:hypothetical protein